MRGAQIELEIAGAKFKAEAHGDDAYEVVLKEAPKPGVLLPPLWDPKMDLAPGYGNTGGTVGHELIHGFDDEGRQLAAACLTGAALGSWPAFTMGAYGVIFFEQHLALWAAASTINPSAVAVAAVAEVQTTQTSLTPVR